jgi:hypothetical protein
MAAFEIEVNGERRFAGAEVTAITLVTEWVPRRKADRVSVHVAVGGTGSDHVQCLGADLKPGDDITIRVLDEQALQAAISAAPHSCSFCAREARDVESLVSGHQIAICDSCLSAFQAVIARSGALLAGTTIRDTAGILCGFCRKEPPEVAPLLVRNGAAICPECLRACVDMRMT